MGWPPRASMEHTDRILIYGPSKRSSLSLTEAWFKPTVLLVGLREKLGTDPRIGEPAWRGLCLEPFFSGVVGSIQICRWLMKGFYTWTTWDMYGRGPYTDWAWKAYSVLVRFSLKGVYRFESPRLSDMSVAYLWQSSHSNLINLMSLM
jgi:hypothetical protein